MALLFLWIKGQYAFEQKELYSRVQQALTASLETVAQRSSFTTNIRHPKWQEEISWNEDSSQVFVFAPNQSVNLASPDSVIINLRRQQAKVLRQQVAANTLKKPDTYETVVFRTVQQSKVRPQTAHVLEAYGFDSLLAANIRLQGVAFDYFYGIKAAGYPGWIKTRNTADTVLLAEKAKPYEPFEELVIYVGFFNQRFQILKTMALELVVAFVLSLLAASGLYFAVKIIEKQKALNALKNNFINNMTHEFKTPIATIAFAVANIENEETIKNAGAIKTFTKIIRDENKRMDGYVEKMLTASVAQKKAFELNTHDVMINELLHEITNAFALRVQSSGGALTLNPDLSLPLIRGDAFLLYNALNNVVDNAIKFSGSNVKIDIGTAVDAGFVVISVSDKGIGLSNKELKRIFEQFYRVNHGNLHTVRGFGLGLSYAQAIISMHGGEILVESKPGIGSTFKIRLPISKSN